MESRSVNVQIERPSDLPGRGVSPWLADKTEDSSVILVKFWKTAGEVYDLQDPLFKDPISGRPFGPTRITSAGLDELSRKKSASASSIISFKGLGGHESHTLNIIHEYRARRDERGELNLVGNWNYMEQSVSVQ